jgi:hypothetical protein
MDFLSLAMAVVPLLALAAAIIEILAKKPSGLAELLQDSEAFARAPLAMSAVAVDRRELIPANDQTRLAA